MALVLAGVCGCFLVAGSEIVSVDYEKEEEQEER